MNTDVAAALARMRADFVRELPERCDRMEQAVLALERHDPDAFDELYRQVHSLKGSGGTFGLPVLTTVCHQFESFLGEVRGGFDREAATVGLGYVDLMRRTAELAGREDAAAASIEQALDRLRGAAGHGRASVLLVEPSEVMRKLCREALAPLSARIAVLDRGLAALERLLCEPFDLLVASRELPDLNAPGLIAAVREAGGRNRAIPVILISSNPAPVPAHLGIDRIIRRDVRLGATLADCAGELLARRPEA